MVQEREDLQREPVMDVLPAAPIGAGLPLG